MSEGAFSPDVSHQVSGLQDHAAEVWPVFLPVVSMRDCRPLYSEALARTDQACGHQRLIATAEEKGFVGEIDCSMLAQTIALLRKTADVAVGVNVSAGTLKRGVDRWLRQLADAPDVSKRIVVELTETQIFDDLKRLSAFVIACRHFGVRFALDDYESGSFDDDLVRRVSPDLIKLSNVWEGGVIGARARIVRYLEQVSEFGISDVVVEWVDAKWKFDLVSSLPISHAQGLFVGRYLSAGELLAGYGNEVASFSVAPEPIFAACW